MTELTREVTRQPATDAKAAKSEVAFREALGTRPLIADGAMGTLLLARRDFLNRSLDELNLSLPALVRDVHREYLSAGAEILETNTFGANRPRLAAYGFGDRVRAVNQAGVRIAREAARDRAFVAGTVGPLGMPMEPLGSLTRDATRAFFREQIDALVSAGVDLLMLETFRDLEELHQAVLAARESAGPDMTVIAHLSVEEDGALADGTPAESFTRRMDEWPVDAIGLNCSSGPAVMLDTIERMRPYTTKPLSALPSAGLPVAGGTPLSPEYMARYATRFLRAGVSIVGGCCGVTPEHIRAMAAEIAGFTQGVLERTVAAVAPVPVATLEDLPVAQKSRLGGKLSAGEFVTLVEIQTPRGVDASSQIEFARQAKDLDFDAVTIVEGPGARLSAAATGHLVQQQAGIEIVLPLRSRGRSASEVMSEILGAHTAEIRNVLCRDGVGLDSIGLVYLVRQLNRGLDLGGNALRSQTTLLVGATVNPAALDRDEELKRFEAKVKAGAEFVVTEPVFDADALEGFLKRMESYRIPTIVGVRRLRSFRDTEFTIHERRVPVPAAIVARMSMAETEEIARTEGIAIAREILERVRGRVAGVQWSGTTPAEAIAPRA